MPIILLVSANICQVPYQVFPLGMMCLHTYLKTHFPNWELHFFDFNTHSYNEFSELLQQKEFSYICISLRNCDDVNFYTKNSFVGHYVTICNISRQQSKAKLIVGGPCVSIFPEEILELLHIDYAIVGEGEKSLTELIRYIECGKEEYLIEGLVYKKGEQIIVNSRCDYISESIVRFDQKLAQYYFSRGGMLNIQTKRGCPYHCIYCSYPVIDGKQVRTLDAQSVVENIKELYYGQKIDYLFFTDSVFNICEEYNIDLAHRIIESKVRINWGAYFSPNNFKKENMELYKRAGLTHIEFGTDSLSDTQLVNYKKHFTFDDIKNASDICYDLGLFYAHFLILGGIGETEQTLNETFDNSKKLQHTVFFPFIGMRIYPKTQLYDIAVKEGLISKEEALKPVYYLSKDCNLNNLKEKAVQTKKRWVFPDEEKNPMVDRLRAKKIRGPLWEYLRY
ncbi:MAG: radical SAM protein [Oscillospiraceae bacterium]|jgi:radical SAM superfamily enzyme YgiQ (UPF0313 family)|nr:radical SAM protein [Oscillospiraceae bacterium]